MGGPPLPPPEELFKKFDADNNDSLSHDEFMKLAEFVKEHHPPVPPGPPGPPRFGGRGPDGPPPRDRPRDFRRDGPPRGEGRGPRDGDKPRGDRERPESPEENAEESI